MVLFALIYRCISVPEYVQCACSIYNANWCLLMKWCVNRVAFDLAWLELLWFGLTRPDEHNRYHIKLNIYLWTRLVVFTFRMKLKTHFYTNEHLGNKFYSIFRMNLNIHLMLFACLFIPFQLVSFFRFFFAQRTIRFLVYLLLLLLLLQQLCASGRLFGLWPLCVRQLLSVINLWVDLWPAYQIHACWLWLWPSMIVAVVCSFSEYARQREAFSICNKNKSL